MTVLHGRYMEDFQSMLDKFYKKNRAIGKKQQAMKEIGRVKEEDKKAWKK